jgi:hypothetical protein
MRFRLKGKNLDGLGVELRLKSVSDVCENPRCTGAHGGSFSEMTA